ncbi:Conserved_hypothetical protein [Hexamita inflata]|uniref:Uncharacterized protein n=1 Tax=Hexamita inflata TaxID=28002 RepID=A0ABP1HW02_9EUKA
MTVWQQNFGQAIGQFLQTKTNLIYESDEDIWNSMISLNDKDKRGLWISVAQLLDIPKKQAHDYYHNTWQKKFYDSFSPYKEQMKQQLIENLNTMNVPEAIQCVIKQLQNMYNQKRFYTHEMYQVLYGIAKKIKKVDDESFMIRQIPESDSRENFDYKLSIYDVIAYQMCINYNLM